MLASLPVDLDTNLHFTSGQLVLTEGRFLASDHLQNWQAWALAPDLNLRHSDHAGVGTLQLCDAHQLLACWHYTLSSDAQALQMMQAFERQIKQLGQPAGALVATTDPAGELDEAPEASEAPDTDAESKPPSRTASRSTRIWSCSTWAAC